MTSNSACGAVGAGEVGAFKGENFKKIKGQSVFLYESKTKNFSTPEANIILYVNYTLIKKKKPTQ